MKTKQAFKESMAFLQGLNQQTPVGQTFGAPGAKETNMKGEFWLSFGKIIDNKLIRNGSELGYVQYLSMCIDNFEAKAKNGSANNAEWDAMSQCLNNFISGIITVRNKLKPGEVVYKTVTKDLAYQIKRRDFDANKIDLEALAENNEFCEGWS